VVRRQALGSAKTANGLTHGQQIAPNVFALGFGDLTEVRLNGGQIAALRCLDKVCREAASNDLRSGEIVTACPSRVRG
jgi:hypothetical protein